MSAITGVLAARGKRIDLFGVLVLALVTAFGGVEGIPTTFLIDRTGQIRDRKVGLVETAEYEKRIVAALN